MISVDNLLKREEIIDRTLIKYVNCERD